MKNNDVQIPVLPQKNTKFLKALDVLGLSQSKGRILNSVHCVFHPGWKYADHLYTLSGVIVGAWELAQPVHSSFVDLRRACNLLPQWVPVECDTAVWSTLHASTVPLYILYALCSLSTGVRAWFDTTCNELDLFPGNGWTLSGLHFGIFMGKMFSTQPGCWGASSGYELQLFLEWFTDDQCLQIETTVLSLKWVGVRQMEYLWLARECLSIRQDELDGVAEERKSWASMIRLLRLWPSPEKW